MNTSTEQLLSKEALTVEFDHHAPEFATNRFAILKKLREQTPIAYTQSHGGHWIVTNYELAKEVLETPEIYSSEKQADGSGGVTIPSVGPRLMPAETDAPIHTQLRALLTPFYSPKALKELVPVIDDIVVTLIDDVITKKNFDIVDDIAEMLPPLLGLRHLGFPEERREAMVKAVKIGLATGVPSDEAAQAFGQACGEMMQFIQTRRANPKDDIISALLASTDPVLSDEDIMWFGMTLFIGGFKNPGAHISNMLLHLGQDTELRQRLIDDRSLIPKANAEFLRYYTAGNSVARNITTDTQLGNAQLKAGERILVLLPAANHDEAMFEGGENFNIDRKRNPNLALGGGPHFCVGFKVANMMFERLLEEIFDRIPNYTVSAKDAVHVEDAGIQAGYVSIPASI